jgi:streptomycin 6-kinase
VSYEAVDQVVRAKAVAVGASGWLAELPTLVRELERAWSIRTGRTIAGGTEAHVVEATLEDGTPAVLKILIPRAGDAAFREITALRLTNGDCMAKLIRGDIGRGALLLERLGVPLDQLRLPVQRRHEILCSLAERVWRPAPDSGLPTGAQKARWLVDFITNEWEALGRPCSERAVAHASSCAAKRMDAHRDERAVLVHGDVHQWNTLASPEGGFKLIDPDGLLAEPEYDLGVVMREDPLGILAGDARQRARWLAARTRRSADAIWEWGVVERVSTGLVCTRVGLEPVGRQMLAVADRLSRVDSGAARNACGESRRSRR